MGKLSWPFGDGVSRWKIKMTFLWVPREGREVHRNEMGQF
jgi:hypothetical protein